MFWITHHTIKEDRNRKTGLATSIRSSMTPRSLNPNMLLSAFMRERYRGRSSRNSDSGRVRRPNAGNRQHRQLFAPWRGTPLILENVTSLPEEFVAELTTFQICSLRGEFATGQRLFRL